MNTLGFWAQLSRPIIGLSPMDGVTNAPYRYITAKYGRPSVSITEFVPVDGLMHAATKLLRDFAYHPIERPVVAQVYGSDPQSFYAVAHLCCELGFDGIDINMGCPARNVASRGAGAGLIRAPKIAQAIIRATKRGVRDWCEGQSSLSAGIPAEIVQAIAGREVGERRLIPVSVKTRIGYDTVVIADWVRQLLESEPAVISIHGRTLKQMYRGQADWDAIAEATEVIHQTETLALGNGDLKGAADIVQRIATSGVDGVLVGRGTMGNPWLLQVAANMCANPDEALPEPPTADERLAVLQEHAEAIEAMVDPRALPQIRRLVKPYTSGLPEVGSLREALMGAQSAAEIARFVADYRTRYTLDKGAHYGIDTRVNIASSA